MEEFVSAVTGGAVWGVGFGLAMSAVQAAGSGLRPVAKTTVRNALNVGDWVRNVTAESRETLQDVYAEARAELDANRQTQTTEAIPRKPA
jgi:hypothetical protein